MSEERKESLDLDFILGQDASETLFNEYEEKPKEEKEDKEENKEETTETVDRDSLFEESESVGSDESEEEKKPKSSRANSSQTNFYSSIATALKEEGIFSASDDSLEIKDADSFAEAFEKEIQSRLDEKQKRIDDALNNNVEVSEIKKYENTIDYLNGITDKQIKDESETGENLRKSLIYQDFLNKGYSQEKARKMVEKSFASGSDLEDAYDALAANKEYFNSEYQDLLDEAREEKEEREEEERKEREKLKKSILEEDRAFGDYYVDKKVREKVFDNLSKVIYRDPDTGVGYNALQKYQKENPSDFLKYISLIFTVTDEFKSLDKLVGSKMKAEKRKYIRELENTLNNTARTGDGSLRYASGSVGDPESYEGWGVDV